jgi:hypothetical protein
LRAKKAAWGLLYDVVSPRVVAMAPEGLQLLIIEIQKVVDRV